MIRVTTPTHTFTLPIATSTCKEILVTYKQDDVLLEYHYENNIVPEGMAIGGNNVVITMSQEDTKAFSPKVPVRAQVRVLTTADKAYASQIFRMSVRDVLNEEVLADD